MLSIMLSTGEKVKIKSKNFKRFNFNDGSFSYVLAEKDQKLKISVHQHHQDRIFNHIDVIKKELDHSTQRTISIAQGQLQNEIVNIEGRIVNAVINKLTKAKNAFDNQNDVINEEDQSSATDDLEVTLAAFYATLIPIFASANLANRLKEFGYRANFTMDQNIKTFIKNISNKVATSHVNTIIDDLQRVMQGAYNQIIDQYLQAIKDTGRSVTDADLTLARKEALSGASQQQIINKLTSKFNDITNNRAKTIARTETNRAFSESQYASDQQFLGQNDLTAQAYKQWVTQSDNPCPICEELASQDPIPFDDNFADLGDTLTGSYTKADGTEGIQTLVVNFEPLEAGNAHVNCQCIYLLIIQ